MFQLILSTLYILLLVTVVIVILVDKGDSGRKLSWLLIIALVPLVGIILYFMIGINYRHHWIFNRRHQRSVDIFKKGTTPELNEILFGHGAETLVREEFRPLAGMMGKWTYPSVSSGNDFEIITQGHRKFELLTEDIRQAKESIHMEYFHFGNDKGGMVIKDLLMEKAAEGVKVRFLHENIANFPISRHYYNDMRKAGVEIVRFTKPRSHSFNLVSGLNYRNHRKVVVIDGKIGYTGGMNINDHYFEQWRDTHIRITGNAVASLQLTFLDSWLTAGGTIDKPVLEYFPMAGKEERTAPQAAPDSRHTILRDKLVQMVPDEPDVPYPMLLYSYEWALLNARKYIWLQTPYFVPPESILNAMKIAALSGIDIRLMLPKVADNFITRPANRAYYDEILSSGVRLFLYDGEFIHAKTFVCDDYLSSIGSANIDNRSFNINYEINTYFYDEETALANKAIFENDLKKCQELRLEEWSRRPWYKRIPESIIRLFAPLL